MPLPRILGFLLIDGVFISLVLLLSTIVSILLPEMILYVGITLVVFVIIFMLNRRIKSRLGKQVAPFSSRSMIRNVDFLIIGDLCDPSIFLPKKSTYINIGRPNRGLIVSYQILRHTHSILNEGGEVVFVIKSNYLKSEVFSVFDIPFLHYTTIKELGLRKIVRRNRWPLIFEPIISVKFTMNRSYRDIFKCIDCPDEEINVFCRDRNLTFRLMIIP